MKDSPLWTEVERDRTIRRIRQYLGPKRLQYILRRMLQKKQVFFLAGRTHIHGSEFSRGPLGDSHGSPWPKVTHTVRYRITAVPIVKRVPDNFFVNFGNINVPFFLIFKNEYEVLKSTKGFYKTVVISDWRGKRLRRVPLSGLRPGPRHRDPPC